MPDTSQPSICFCILGSADPTYGGGRVYHAISQGLMIRGWKCHIADCQELIGPHHLTASFEKKLQVVYDYIQKHQNTYDVFEYDIKTLPLSRFDFSDNIILAARSVLLELHMDKIKFPRPFSIKKVAGSLFKAPAARKEMQINRARIIATAITADVIHVTGDEDVTELEENGISKKKILKLPYGLDPHEYERLSKNAPSKNTDNPTILLLGTFDYRKGAADSVKILNHISKHIPNVKLRLAGTKGLFSNSVGVLSFFPARLRHRLEIIPRYTREDLPNILAGINCAIFPSYLEGCPFALLEQMAAGIPIAAYSSPGATILLDEKSLIQRGSWRKLADSVINLLSNDNVHNQESNNVRIRARDCVWDRVFDELDQYYRTLLKRN